MQQRGMGVVLPRDRWYLQMGKKVGNPLGKKGQSGLKSCTAVVFLSMLLNKTYIKMHTFFVEAGKQCFITRENLLLQKAMVPFSAESATSH